MTPRARHHIRNGLRRAWAERADLIGPVLVIAGFIIGLAIFGDAA